MNTEARPGGQLEPIVRRLRAWSDDADSHGKPWVPVSPATLRDIAEAVDCLVRTASAGTDEPVERAVSAGIWFGPHRAEQLRNALARFKP